uniref:Ig-like and fibronectin type-III domain-containing protein n=1 Tax=Cepaea nemoralis TaxID=28835 RepID=A0A345S6Z3_CEPNE|nr:Ig-like and fibronectin type-III domain-containing protein [Cepaea nemoralis]
MPDLPLLGLVILSMALLSCAQEPIITSSPETIGVYTGQTAQLKCSVTNGNDVAVTWSFLTHNYVIYDGTQILAHDKTKFSVSNTAAGNVKNVYLQILNVGKYDQGFYKCAIAGTNQHMITHLDVLDIPEMLDAAGPPLNMTDCCKSENVSQSCLPGCYPSQIDLSTFDAIASCGAVNNLRGLSKCFTAGSNHDNCCLNKNVDSVCLGFCHNAAPTNISQEYYNKCFTPDVINGVFTCFEMGFEVLPSEPTEVEAIPVHDGISASILVKWSEPKKNPQAVTGYMILYKARNQISYNSIQLKDPKSRSYRLGGDTFQIQSDMDYKIRVSALADHGVSFGSVEVDVYISNSTKSAQITADIDTCCSNRGVTDACRSSLCHPRTWSSFDTSFILGCYPQLSDIFTCLVGERNHTNCCAAFDVTADCLPVCSGQPPPFSDALISCVSQMGIIEACVQQGYTTLPAPPTEVTIVNVEASSATFLFTPSTSNSVLYYVVQLRKGNENASFDYVMNTTASESSVYLNNLRPDTYYWIRIISVGQTADSLPSETVSFLTYPEGYSDPAPTPVTNLPHNMTECCRKYMPDVCWKGCEYRANITEYYRSHLIECFMHVGSVLACGADGRDHTECCRSRGVRSECVNLCAHTKTGPLESKYHVCVEDTPQAITCFNEGIVNLPRHPDVVVSNVSKNTISLKWEQPKTSGLIDSYSIRYRVANSLDKTMEVTNKTFYILQNLEPSTQYEITVTSENSNGTSAPSPVITQYTLSDGIKSPTFNTTEVSGRALWQNVSDCCENSVPQECMDQCLNEQTTHPQTTSCITESHKMLACFADGKDHRLCCEKGGLSHLCQPICGGHVLATDVTMATCMSYTNRDIILSCYLENKDLIPDAPTNFGVKVVDSKGSVKLEWSPAANCRGPCTYAAHYWKDSQDSGVTSIYNISDTFITIDLLPDNRYTFTVTAHNEHGSSSPTAWQTLYIVYYERNVNLYLDGSKKWVDQGQPAKLICARSGFNPDETFRVKWLFNNRRDLNNDGKLELLIPKVDAARDEGEYTCTVTDSVVSSSDSLFLPVKYSPMFKQFEEDNAQPKKGESTSFECLFKGLPDSDPKGWWKDGHPLTQDGRKYIATLNPDFWTGLTSYKLKIFDIVEADYGIYSLTVSNAYGSGECQVDLTDPANITVHPPSGQQDLKKCCAAKDMSLLCQELCGFHVNVTEIVKDMRYTPCIPYFETYITCGADGRDHSTCCQSKGVLPHCVPLCSGVVPQDLINSEKILECLADHTVIFACAQQGHLLLPYAPEEVTLSYNKNDKSILIRWEAHYRTEDKVEHYNIFYNFTGSPVPKNTSVNGRLSQYYIRNVQPHKVYNVWMTSGNKHGNSLSTGMKMIDTESGTEDQPMADAQTSNDVAIGVGVTLGVIAVVAIVILILYIMRSRARFFALKLSKPVKFENPGYGNQGQIKIHGVDDQYSYGRLREDRAPPEVLNIQDSSFTGESATDSTFDNPMYKTQQPSTPSTAATLTVEPNIR